MLETEIVLTYNQQPMRACLLALLMLFLLPSPWAGAAAENICAHEPCAQSHVGFSMASQLGAADNHAGESHALNPHCGGCHAGALALLGGACFFAGDTLTRVAAGTCSWTQVLLTERPERPQWSALA
jgi:hypothetical protein